ncbi:hypothetical protein PMAYCL1PPCAC_24998, partial [Pristionchus mayeri]
FFSLSISDVSGGERLLSVFETIPSTFYTLVHENLPSIHEKANEYILSAAKERAENKTVRPDFCVSDNRQKPEEVSEQAHSDLDDYEKKKKKKSNTKYDKSVLDEAALMKERFANRTILIGALAKEDQDDIPTFVNNNILHGKAALASGIVFEICHHTRSVFL